MAGTTLVFAELDNGRIRDSVWEAIGQARSLGGEVATVVVGSDVSAQAQTLSGRGGGKVFAVSHEALAHYSADGYGAVLKQIAGEVEADLWLFPHSPLGWDLAPKLAVLLGGGCGTEVFRVTSDGEGLVFTKKAFKGKFDMSFRIQGAPRIVTLQSGAHEAFQDDATGEVVDYSPNLDPGAIREQFIEIREAEKSADAVDLTQSQIIVAGGRGLGGPEKFEIMEALAKALGGDVGASRPVTDAGWLPADRQIGSSGVRVKPKLYIAAGISGAIQHLVGMKDSGFIVAINKDPKAPIFEVCDVGVVGDLFEVIPALTQAIQEAKG